MEIPSGFIGQPGGLGKRCSGRQRQRGNHRIAGTGHVGDLARRRRQMAFDAVPEQPHPPIAPCHQQGAARRAFAEGPR